MAVDQPKTREDNLPGSHMRIKNVVHEKQKDYKQKNKQCNRRTETTGDSFFYSIPNSMLLTALIVLVVLLVIIFLIIFRFATKNCNFNDSSNGVVSSFLSLVGLPFSVVLSFIVASAWESFADAGEKENEEATKLLLLYDLLQDMPGAEDIQEAIKE